ncbi:Bardet-Biedl syndrome 4 protein homolog, partial [Geodia barretti]
PAVALAHLDDYENACKSYEQALTLERDNPLIHLNYSIVLYNNGEMRAAGKQFQLFKSKTQTHRPTNPDLRWSQWQEDWALPYRWGRRGRRGRGGERKVPVRNGGR